MWVRSLGREDPLEEEMATHSSENTLVGEIPWTEERGMATVHGVTESDTTEVTQHAHTPCGYPFPNLGDPALSSQNKQLRKHCEVSGGRLEVSLHRQDTPFPQLGVHLAPPGHGVSIT